MTDFPQVRLAKRDDIPTLAAMMEDFYREAGSTFDSATAVRAFGELVVDTNKGLVGLLSLSGNVVGYVVLTFGFSMEFGGRDAFVDDLYVRLAYRGRGCGSRALEQVREWEGVRALHLEVAHENSGAERLYKALGFQSGDRQLLTLRISQTPAS